MKKTKRKKVIIVFGSVLLILCMTLTILLMRDEEREEDFGGDLVIELGEDENKIEADAKEEKNSSESENNINKNEDKEQIESGKNSLVATYIPGTDMYIETIVPYDGVYIEGGMDKEVKGVTVMVLSNKSDEDVEYIEVSLKRNGKPLNFKASTIPKGATVVIQEANGEMYEEGKYTDIKASVATINLLDTASKSVKVEDNGDNSITVTNLTDKEIPCIRIFYKLYMEDENVYVGGITYTAKVEGLESKETMIVTPSHYISDYAKVMMIRTYDTTE